MQGSNSEEMKDQEGKQERKKGGKGDGRKEGKKERQRERGRKEGRKKDKRLPFPHKSFYQTTQLMPYTLLNYLALTNGTQILWRNS